MSFRSIDRGRLVTETVCDC